MKLNRLQFFWEVIKMIVLNITIFFLGLLFFTGLATSPMWLSALKALSTFLLIIVLIFNTVQATKRRLRDVAPNTDPVLLNGLYWLSFLILGGIPLIVLMIWPGKSAEPQEPEHE